MILTDLSSELLTLVLRSAIEQSIDSEDIRWIFASRLVCKPFCLIIDDVVFGVGSLDSHTRIGEVNLSPELFARAIRLKLSLPPSKRDCYFTKRLRGMLRQAETLGLELDAEDIQSGIIHLFMQWQEVTNLNHYHLDQAEWLAPKDEEQQDAFVIAAFFGREEILRCMVTEGVKPEKSRIFIGGPLWAAILNSHYDVTKLLIAAGANVNERTKRWRSRILETACARQDRRMLQILARSGFSLDPRCHDLIPAFEKLIKHGLHDELSILLDCGEQNKTKLYSELLLSAIDSRQFTIAENMIHRGAEPNRLSHISRGWSDSDYNDFPLTRACRSGSVTMVKLLLDAGADIRACGRGEPALVAASALGNLDMIKTLVEHGADVNRAKYHLTDWPFEAQTPLQEACLNGHLLAVAYLLKHGASVHSTDLQTGTVLAAAAISGHHQIVELLLKAGARPNHKLRTNKYYTPLARACISGNERSVDMLLNYGAFVNISGAGLEAPVQIASDLGFDDIVEILVRRGAANPIQRPIISVRDYIQKHNIVDRIG